MILNTVEGQNTTGIPAVSFISVIGDTAIPGNSYINEYSAMTVPAFWSAVRWLSETLASLRRAVHQELPGSRIVAPVHPLNTLLRRRISDVSSPYRTFETWVHHASVWGNGYLWIKRDSRGNPVALLNINPEIVSPFVFNGRKYHYVQTEDGKGDVLDDADVLHLAMIGFDGVRGYPLVQLMRYAIETNKQAEKFTGDYFQRGTFLNGAIEVPTALTPEQLTNLRESVRAFRASDGRSKFEAIVLQNGATLNNSTVPNQTSQLLETRRFSDIQICQMLRVSPHVVYQADSQKLANVQQMGAEVVKYSLNSWMTKIEDEINSKLFSAADQDAGFYFRLHADALLRGDEGTLSTQLLAEVNGGIRTVNEARQALELEPVGPEGDVLRVPVNYPVASQQPAEATDGPNAGDDTTDAGAAPSLPPPPADPDDVSGSDDPIGQPASYSAVLAPLVAAAAERIDGKTGKAFANRAGDPADKLTRWGNVFAAEQAAMVREVFAPIHAAAAALGHGIDVEKLAERYERAIKLRASTGEAQDIATIYGGLNDGH